MTNKIPVVGKKYKRKGLLEPYEVEIIAIYRKELAVYDNPNFGTPSYADFRSFFDLFEELPENNLQQTEEVKVNETPFTVDFKKGEVSEVERASGVAPKPMEMVMDYIAKQIDAIDKARIEMRQENPNFLPRLA